MRSFFKTIANEYAQSDQRLIFLDYDGTLVGFNSNPLDSKPDKELKEIIKGLTEDPKNKVVIISGRDKDTLDEWMRGFKIDIIAEHGVWNKAHGKDWETFTTMNNNWKGDILKLLNSYVDRTPGSFIEQKDYSLVWHYRKVETGLGEVRTRELTSHLKYITTDKDLQVLEGDMVVEIKNSQINKGKAATAWISKNKASFHMACGDDWTDEDTFKSMPHGAHTVKVGGMSSAAKYRVEDFREIRKLLKDILQHQ